MQASPNDPRKEKARPSSSQRWQPPVTDYGVTVYPGGSKPFFYHASLKYLFFVSSPPDLKWAVKTNAFIGKFNGQTFHCCREPSGNLLTPPRLRTTGLSNSFALRRKAVAAHTHQSPAREGCGYPHLWAGCGLNVLRGGSEMYLVRLRVGRVSGWIPSQPVPSPDLKCCDSQENISCSDGIFLSQLKLMCVRWCDND